jgi:hypothetical protein
VFLTLSLVVKAANDGEVRLLEHRSRELLVLELPDSYIKDSGVALAVTDVTRGAVKKRDPSRTIPGVKRA